MFIEAAAPAAPALGWSRVDSLGRGPRRPEKGGIVFRSSLVLVCLGALTLGAAAPGSAAPGRSAIGDPNADLV